MLRGKSGRATRRPYAWHLTEPDSHEGPNLSPCRRQSWRAPSSGRGWGPPPGAGGWRAVRGSTLTSAALVSAPPATPPSAPPVPAPPGPARAPIRAPRLPPPRMPPPMTTNLTPALAIIPGVRTGGNLLGGYHSLHQRACNISGEVENHRARVAKGVDWMAKLGDHP